MKISSGVTIISVFEKMSSSKQVGYQLYKINKAVDGITKN